MSLYPHKVSIVRKRTDSRDATGHPVESEVSVHAEIKASVQHNRTTTGASGNQRYVRNIPEQPGTLRIYTPIDVSDVKPDDILIHLDTGERFKVLRAIDQAGRRRRWRIEASIF